MKTFACFNALEQLKKLCEKQFDINHLFQQVLENPQNIFHSREANFLMSQLRIVSPMSLVDKEYKEIFDDYIKLAKTNFNSEKFSSFLRYLSVYIVRKISSDNFVKLILNLLENNIDSILIRDLPIFMASLDCCYFANDEESKNDDTEEEVIFIILSLTSSITNISIAKTVSKCLYCLSTGLIDFEIANEWLTPYCKKELIQKIKDINDYSYFNPSRFPSELILCYDFIQHNDCYSVYQDFIMNQEDTIFNGQKGNVCDVLQMKMRGLRKIIKKVKYGEITSEDLKFAYGSLSSIIVNADNYKQSIVNKFGKIYEETQNKFEKLISFMLESIDKSNIEYRFILKKLFNHENFIFHYQLPGMRVINFTSREAAQFSLIFVKYFTKNYFNEPQRSKIINSCDILSSIFSFNNMFKLFVANEKHIYSIVYLSKITEFLEKAGDISEVCIVEGEILEEQSSSFGKDIIELVKSFKTMDYTDNLFSNSIIQHIDIVLTLCTRQLFEFNDGYLPEYPNEISNLFTISTISQYEEENQFSIICNTVYSPFLVNFSEEETE